MSSLQQWLAAQVRGMIDGDRQTRSERQQGGDELSQRLADHVGQQQEARQRALYGRGAPVPRPEAGNPEGDTS